MTALATRLGETHHVSVLLRRARALGLARLPDLIALAVKRGCDHYRGMVPEADVEDPGMAKMTNEELAVALLLGEHPFDATAVRCAAQLLSGDGIDPGRVAHLARRERCERVVAYIARAGVQHDEHGGPFWGKLLEGLPPRRSIPDGTLPHWTRFAALTGVQDGVRRLKSSWLRPKR
jgi:hypothetical protein